MKELVIDRRLCKAKYLKVDAVPEDWENATVNGADDDPENPQMPFVVEVNGEKRWRPVVDIQAGRVTGWPDVDAHIHYKVCDNGHYELLNESGEVIANADEWKGGSYVPPILDCSPDKGSHVDYIIMSISKEGEIENWKIDFDSFHCV